MDETPIDRLVQATWATLAQYFRETGLNPDPLWQAARAVVWARYYQGDDGWEKLKEAIGNLEQIVGRPKDFDDIWQ